MAQTAVEYLADKVSEIIGYIPQTVKQEEALLEALEKAKEMEKQQITDAFNDGNWVGRCAIVDDNLSNKTIEKSAQTYYNETFKSE
jgi:hypothetical protein